MPLTKQSASLITETRNHAPNPFNQLSAPEYVRSVLTNIHKTLINAIRTCSSKKIASKDCPVPVFKEQEWIPNFIRVSLDDKNLKCKKCYFTAGKRKATVYCVAPNIGDVEIYVRPIQWWLNALETFAQLSSSHCAQTVTIYLYLCDHPKTIPDSNCIAHNHANTAFTTSCPKDATIVIFRREEWFKVLIHETFHAFGLDFSNFNDEQLRSQCLSGNQFSIEHLKLYEAYTECWATICHTIICVITLDPCAFPTDNEFLSKFEFYMSVEREFSMRQLSVVLNVWNTSLKDIQQATVTTPIYLCEKTASFSYYVVKCAILSQWPQFIKWCTITLPSTSPSIVRALLQFTSTPEKFACFANNCLQEIRDDEIFKHPIVSRKWVSLRMTCVETDVTAQKT